jgi:hypothetical protein
MSTRRMVYTLSDREHPFNDARLKSSSLGPAQPQRSTWAALKEGDHMGQHLPYDQGKILLLKFRISMPFPTIQRSASPYSATVGRMKLPTSRWR